MSAAHVYHAKLLKVVDGDTVDLVVDLGFHMTASLRFRLLAVDTPERGEAGHIEAKSHVHAALNSATSIRVFSHKDDSFGRWLADVHYMPPGASHYVLLNEELLSKGLAVPYRK